MPCSYLVELKEAQQWAEAGEAGSELRPRWERAGPQRHFVLRKLCRTADGAAKKSHGTQREMEDGSDVDNPGPGSGKVGDSEARA